MESNYKNCFINLICCLGDIVAAEPITRYIKNKYNNVKIHWILKPQYKDLIKFNPYVDSIIEVNSHEEADKICENEEKNNNTLIIDCHFDGRTDNETGYVHRNKVNSGIKINNLFDNLSILESFSLTAGLEKLNEAPIFYLDKDKKLSQTLKNGKPYVIFHCISGGKEKNWTEKKWNDLAQKILNLNFNVVEIGDKQVVKSTNPNYYNLTDIRDLQEIALLIKNCYCFIGLDSGFSHIANCFDKYSILIFGKYLNFYDRNVYSGNYGKYKNCTIITAGKYLAKYVPFQLVYQVFLELINNKTENPPPQKENDKTRRLLNTKINYRLNILLKMYARIEKKITKYKARRIK